MRSLSHITPSPVVIGLKYIAMYIHTWNRFQCSLCVYWNRVHCVLKQSSQSPVQFPVCAGIVYCVLKQFIVCWNSLLCVGIVSWNSFLCVLQYYYSWLCVLIIASQGDYSPAHVWSVFPYSCITGWFPCPHACLDSCIQMCQLSMNLCNEFQNFHCLPGQTDPTDILHTTVSPINL